jgi:glycosyltransferase involved in cell wall biosynthesis
MPLKFYHPAFLQAAIESLVRQNSPEWTLLIIVEPEDRDRLATELADHLVDSRIRLIANEGGKYPGAFNTGMRQAETEFVAILLGDDLWDPRAVEVLAAHIRAHPEVDFFHTGRRIVDDAGNAVGRVFLPQTEIAAGDFVWKSPVKHLLCWRRSAGLRVGGVDEAVITSGPDDYDFPWTMFESGARFRSIPDPLYIYRDHRSGFRNTTHLTRHCHLTSLRYVLTKHGVPPEMIRRRLEIAKAGFLRQCLYRTRFDRWLKQRLNWKRGTGWRLDYSK